MNYAGINYHKRYSVVCIIDAPVSILHEERIEHGFPERFAALLGAHAPVEVAFEATMNWSWLYELLEVTTVYGLPADWGQIVSYRIHFDLCKRTDITVMHGALRREGRKIIRV